MKERDALLVMYDDKQTDFIRDYALSLLAIFEADEAHRPETIDDYAKLQHVLFEYASCKAIGRPVSITYDDAWRLVIGGSGARETTAQSVIDDWADDCSDW